MDADAVELIFRHQHDLLFKEKVAVGEITMTSSEKIASEFWSLLPFSRGSVHLHSRNGTGTYKVDINPRFFQIDYDQQLFIALSRLTQKFWATDPAAKQVTGRIDPRTDQVPTDASDEEWKSYIRSASKFFCFLMAGDGSAARPRHRVTAN